MRPTAAVIEIVVLAAWLGAAILFAAAVAPAAFAVLPSRSLAGAIVGRVLPQILYAGIVVGIVVVALDWGGVGSRARLVAGLVTIVSCAIAQFAIGARIERVRQSIPGAIEALSPDDPRRVAFGRLHAMSVGWLGIAMIAALVALVLAARALPPRS